LIFSFESNIFKGDKFGSHTLKHTGNAGEINRLVGF